VVTSTNPASKRLYNGKELQDELGLNMYDYGWRNYMPDIGRWSQIDPLFNDLKFAHDNSQIDEDDQQEVYMSIINDLELGGAIYNTDNLNPYGYGYNNPVSFDDPDGRCPSCIIGGLIGAAVDYGAQVGSNYVQGNENPWTSNISLSSIALSAAEGALTQGGSVLRKIAVKGAVMAVNNTVDVKLNSEGKLKGSVEKNPKNIIKNIAVDAVTGQVAKGIGKGAVKQISKHANVNSGTIAKTIKNAVRATGGNVTGQANQNIKKVSKQIVNQTANSIENAVKTVTIKPINDAKDRTNQ
jgi:RHS repeat-associated protein